MEYFGIWLHSERSLSSVEVGDLVVKKMDAETKEAISGAEFTVYRWKNNTWSEFKKMNWVKKTGSYLLEGILDTDSENENSVLWRQRIQLVMQEAGSRNFPLTRKACRRSIWRQKTQEKTGSLKIKKTEENSGKALSGATYQVIASGAITTVNGTVLFPDQAVAAVLKTDENGEAFKTGWSTERILCGKRRLQMDMCWIRRKRK